MGQGHGTWNEHREVSATMTEGQLFSRPPEPTSINKHITFYEIPKFGEVWIVSQKLKSKKSRPIDLNITLPFTIPVTELNLINKMSILNFSLGSANIYSGSNKCQS